MVVGGWVWEGESVDIVDHVHEVVETSSLGRWRSSQTPLFRENIILWRAKDIPFACMHVLGMLGITAFSFYATLWLLDGT